MELGVDQRAQVYSRAVPALERGQTFTNSWYVLPVLPSSPEQVSKASDMSCSRCAEEDISSTENCVDHLTGDYDGDGCQATVRHSGVCLSPAKRNTGKNLWLQIQTYTGLARTT